MSESNSSFFLAKEDFLRARQQASMQEVLARLTGRSVDLLSYEEVRRKLHATGTGIRRGLQEIPIDSIIGSAGRYTDFTRTFLPRSAGDIDRWAHVMTATTDPGSSGLPPIEVYKIGEAYFVYDGHHRVSVAKQLGNRTIEAYVTEVPAKVALTPDTSPDDLILKAEQTEFLEATRLDVLRPQSDLRVTEPGSYATLLEHIRAHHYFMGVDGQRDVPLAEAVAHWHDTIYLPVVEAIRQKGILRDFPGRTEADLYLWVSDHRTELQQGLGEIISPGAAASHLAEQYSPRAGRVAARIGRSLADAVLHGTLEDGPPAGKWREERTSETGADRLFREILVPVAGDEHGWTALDQAVLFAHREGSAIQGLHVERDIELTESVREEFACRCAGHSLACGLVVESGDVTRRILERALLADLVIVSLTHPPSTAPLLRLGSGFRTLIRQCARPILAVPSAHTQLDRLLLAYDGSPKSEEALFVAAYLAGQWRVPLAVVTVIHGAHANQETLADAEAYLRERAIPAEFIAESGKVAKAILQTAAAQDSHLLIMGGYGNNPMVEAMMGSDLDVVLRESPIPILICR